MADHEELLSGNPDAVAELVSLLDATKTSMETQVGRLRGFAGDEEWVGIAADQFRDSLGELPERIDLLVTRYGTVSGALSTYHPKLAECQERARQALADIEQAEDDLARAESGIDDMEAHEDSARRAADDYNDANPDAAPRQPEPWGGTDWYAARDNAERALEDAEDRLEQAVQDYDDAANACADTIADAINDDLENEGGFSAWVDRQATALVDALPIETLANICTVIGAVLGVLSIFFPVLAPFALAFGVMSLLLDSTLAIAGEGSWTNVALDVVGIATFGVGRAFGAAGRASQTASRASSAVNAAENAVTAADDAVRYAQWSRSALASTESMAGISATSRGGTVVYGAAARSVLNAQYAADVASGTRAADAARAALATTRTSAAADVASVASRLPGASGLPTARTWGWAFSGGMPQASAAPAGAGIVATASANAADFASAFGSGTNAAMVTGAAADVAGVGVSGVQVADVAFPGVVPEPAP